MTIPERVRSDALPDGLPFNTPCKHYNECGCEVSACCFNCPLPVCKYEEEQGMQTVRAKQSYLAIVHLLDEGRSVGWIMQVMGISRRTVYRAQESQNSATAPLTDTLSLQLLGVSLNSWTLTLQGCVNLGYR